MYVGIKIYIKPFFHNSLTPSYTSSISHCILIWYLIKRLYYFACSKSKNTCPDTFYCSFGLMYHHLFFFSLLFSWSSI